MTARPLASRFRTDCLRSLPADSKPIVIPDMPNIARKPISTNETAAETNDTTQSSNGPLSKRKRSRGDDDVDQADTVKRSKVHASPTADNEVILVDDRSNGAIVIDDD